MVNEKCFTFSHSTLTAVDDF
jgi:hypothetical protein